MNKIRSLLELQDAMSGEFAWRKKELSQLKDFVRVNKDTLNRSVSIRSAIPLLYAHWEGFVKQIGTIYLRFVSCQRLRHSELAPHFLALSMGKVINDAAASQKTRIRLAVVHFFRDEDTKRCNLDWRSGINTRANLNASVLSDIMVTLGLDYAPFETKEKLIDEKLLSNRNNIAHGKYLLIDFDEYIALHDEVVAMMYDFYQQVEAAADHGKYKV